MESVQQSLPSIPPPNNSSPVNKNTHQTYLSALTGIEHITQTIEKITEKDPNTSAITRNGGFGILSNTLLSLLSLVSSIPLPIDIRNNRNNNNNEKEREKNTVLHERTFGVLSHLERLLSILTSEGLETRDRVVYEIYTTEYSILKFLHLLKKFFYDPIKSNKLLTTQEINSVFSTVNISVFIEFHYGLLSDLASRLNEWNQPNKQKIGDIFLNKVNNNSFSFPHLLHLTSALLLNIFFPLLVRFYENI